MARGLLEDWLMPARDELISRVALHSGLASESARATLEAVLRGLRGALGRPEVEARR